MRKVFVGIAVLVALIVVGGIVLVASYDFEDYRGIVSAEVEKATGRKLDIAGDLNLRVFTLSPAIVASELRFANAAWGSRKDMATVKRLEAVVSLTALIFGDIVVKELVLVEPDILLETNKADAGNWIMAGASAPAGAESAKPDTDSPDTDSDTGSADLPTVNRLRMEGARITYRDGRTGQVTAILVDKVEIESAGRTSPIEVSFVGSADDKPIEISASLGSLAALLDGDGPWPVDVTAAIGASRIAGKGELAPQAMPMRVRLDFDATRFDLGDLPGRGSKSKRMFSAEPFSLSAFRAIDAVVTAKVETLVGVTGLQFRNLEARAVMKNGTLIVNPVKAQVAEGTFEASATLVAGNDTAKLIARAALRKGKLAAAVREMTGAETLTGPFDAKAELRGTGLSLAKIMASARGHATLVSGVGRLDNKFFGFLSADVVRAVSPWAPSQAATELRCLAVRFDIAGGVGRSKVLVLDTTRATIVGEGDVNLRNERLDITFEPTTKDLSVLSVAALVPLKMVGPIDDPTVEPAVGATVTGAAKVVFGGAVDAARWVGSQLGVSSKSKKQGDPCPRARAIAGGSPPPAATSSSGTAAPASKDKGVLDTIKGLFD